MHCIDDHFFWTWKVNILLKCTISNILWGARMKACYRAPNKSNYAIMESRCGVRRYCVCNLMCAKVNMFVRLPLKRATVLHKWILVPYNEDSFSCWLWLCPRPYSHLFYSIVTEWLWNGNRLTTWLTIIAGLFLSGHKRLSLPPCFCSADMKTNIRGFVNLFKIMCFPSCITVLLIHSS